MKKITLYLLLLLALPTGMMAQNETATVGTTGADFATLREAFDFINLGNYSGNITLHIVDNTIEDATAVLYESGHDGLSNYSSVTIYPTTASLTISGNIDGPLIDLNGASNITFDGRVNQSGAKDLNITNTSAGNSASTLRFITSAKNNTIKYCKILGSEGSSSSGIIFFSTDGTGGGGNSSNTINNNDITSYVSSGRPMNVIYSNGSSSPDENSGITVSNNNIFDFLNNLSASNGLYLNSNSNAWNISGNSFYETTSFVPTGNVAYNIIQINNTSGTGFIVSGNYIGGQGALCGGSAWTKTSAFDNILYAININVGTGTASSIQNNTIKNFSWSNSTAASWTGINIAGGDVNIGTVTGNIIGASGTGGSIIVSAGATNTNIYAINFAGSGVVNCQNNNIGYIIANNGAGTNSTNFFGISNAGSGTTTISNNTISQIISTSASTGTTGVNNQTVYGIFNTRSGTVTINSNNISNLTNGTTNTTGTKTGLVDGIASSAGTNTISNNIIHDLTIANANNTATQTASVCGIALTGTSSPKTVTGNTIYSLSNTYASFAGSVIGLYFNGSTGTNIVSGNFFHSLSVSSSSTNASIYAIKIASGTTTYSNNIINLNGNTSTTIYGIYETGASGNNNTLYFNSVYIAGTPTSGALNSYALYSALISNNRDFRNNIFYNARSNGGATGKHYAIRVAGTSAALTIDYNDYYAPGTGGVLGLFFNIDKGTLALWKAATGKDGSSLNIDPTFTSAGSTNPIDYKIVSASLIGVLGTGITIDFGLNPRGNTAVSMGAWEKDINLNKWIGTTSNIWGTTTNWTAGALPALDANIIFDAAPLNDCYLDLDRSVTDITNGSTKSIVTNGHKLTIKGNLNFTSGAQIDASLASSTLEFAGASAQFIPAGVLLNDKIFNLIVNNANNVILNGSINLQSTLTVNLGRLDASTVPFYNPTITFSGSVGQSLEANQYLNDEIFNLVIDNAIGVSVNSNLTVDNNLTVNSGKLFKVNPGKLLTVSGTITNNAGVSGFVIKSDGTGDGKLINNTSVVDGTVELFLTGDYTFTGAARFHYFVPPVLSMSFDNSSISSAATDLGLTYFNGDLASYSESAAAGNKDAGWQYFDGYGSTTPFSTLESSMGYNIFLSSNDKISFKGTLNATDHTFSSLSFTNLGWNLVGNPYPCNYDLSGIPELTGIGDGVNNTIYFNHDGGFAYWNLITGGTTGYSDIIAPMQGFFVHVISGGQSLHLPASSKTIATASPSRSKGVSTTKKIKLVLNNGPVPDETIVCLIDKATTGFDGDFDGYKLFGKSNTTEPYIYTELNTVKYAINAVPEPTTTPLVIPVTIVLKTAGTYKIDITEFENLDGFSVVLKHGAVETTLSKDASYSFTLAAGTYTDFQLIFNNISTDIEKTTTEKLKTWYSNSFLYINYPVDISADKGNLSIYDIQGRMVYNNNMVSVEPGQTIQIPIRLPKGMYITRFNTNNQSLVSKIVVF